MAAALAAWLKLDINPSPPQLGLRLDVSANVRIDWFD